MEWFIARLALEVGLILLALIAAGYGLWRLIRG